MHVYMYIFHWRLNDSRYLYLIMLLIFIITLMNRTLGKRLNKKKLTEKKETFRCLDYLVIISQLTVSPMYYHTDQWCSYGH